MFIPLFLLFCRETTRKIVAQRLSRSCYWVLTTNLNFLTERCNPRRWKGFETSREKKCRTRETWKLVWACMSRAGKCQKEKVLVTENRVKRNRQFLKNSGISFLLQKFSLRFVFPSVRSCTRERTPAKIDTTPQRYHLTTPEQPIHSPSSNKISNGLSEETPKRAKPKIRLPLKEDEITTMISILPTDSEAVRYENIFHTLTAKKNTKFHTFSLNFIIY